jgi:DNA invertase Pin-like site-specific DNA recombinase
VAGKGKRKIEAIGYMRTSSVTNVGRDKDSEVRQRVAIESYAKGSGYTIIDRFYDPAVKGSDAVTERPGFKDMLERIANNGVRTIIVESPDRFARDLAVQLAGHDFLKKLGVALIPATAPDFFTEDTPTAVLVRQVLGAIAQFEKASLVAKLKAARDRKIAQGIKCAGRKTYLERSPELVAAAKALQEERPRLSLRKIAARLAEQGYTAASGEPYATMSVRGMLASCRTGGQPNSAEVDRAALFNALVAYTGTYKVDGSKVILHFEASANPGVSDRTYAADISGNKLMLTSEPFTSGITGQRIITIRTFERVE